MRLSPRVAWIRIRFVREECPVKLSRAVQVCLDKAVRSRCVLPWYMKTTLLAVNMALGIVRATAPKTRRTSIRSTGGTA